MDKKTPILITGATGFIGSFLIEELQARGYRDITAVARRSSDTGFLKSKNVKIVTGDITDRASIDGLAGGYDVVFHCAAAVTIRNKKVLHAVNVRGTENICRWALEHKIGKFIYLSSMAVILGNAEIPLREDMPYKTTNQYGLSKIAAEKAAIGFRAVGLPMVIVRPCMVYGEGEPHVMGALARFIQARILIIPGQGKAKWHLVSVRNVAACLAHCMEDERALGGTFNIADKEVLTVREVARVIAGELGAPEPFLLPDFLTEFLLLLPFVGKRVRFLLRDHVYSIASLERVLGFVPPYRVDPELTRTGAFFRKKHSSRG